MQRRFIISIGVGEALYSDWELPQTEQDAEDIAQSLQELTISQSDCKTLVGKNATLDGIKDAFHWLSELAYQNPNSTAFIYYSGHGIRREIGQQYKYLLFTHNSRYLNAEDYSEDEIEHTFISSEKLGSWINAIPAQNIIVFLDCCHAQGFGDNASVLKDESYSAPSRFIQELANKSGRAIISSSTDNENSWILQNQRNSVFTDYLLKGFKESSIAHDGNVGVMSLFPFVSSGVRKTVEDITGYIQQPVFSARNLKGDIPVTHINNINEGSTKHNGPLERVHFFQIQQTEDLYKSVQEKLIALQKDIETRITQVDTVPLMRQREFLYEELNKLANKLQSLYDSRN